MTYVQKEHDVAEWKGMTRARPEAFYRSKFVILITPHYDTEMDKWDSASVLWEGWTKIAYGAQKEIGFLDENQESKEKAVWCSEWLRAEFWRMNKN